MTVYIQSKPLSNESGFLLFRQAENGSEATVKSKELSWDIFGEF